MNFPEYDCDNEEILEFLSYLPITTEEDYPWMQKYIEDLQLHEKKGEYELAVISAHMIYMFIIYCFILKKWEFDIDKIKADFQCDLEHCPKYKTDINPYLYVHKGDKKCFNHLKLDKKTTEQHNKIVKIRDELAHCSGNILIETDFISYLQKCIENIKEVKKNVLEKFCTSPVYKKALNDNNSISDIISDFLLSKKEWEEIFKEFANEYISDYLSNPNNWEDMLNNTIPANYGINGSEFYVESLELNYDDINEELIQGTFTADVSYSIDFQMASSKPDDGYEEHYYETHNISGTFEYDLISNNFSVEMDNQPLIDFYAE